MKTTNPLIYLGFIIHFTLSLIAGAEEDFILYFLAVPLLGNVIGLLLLSFTNRTKLGANIFMWSSFLFVPIGMIAIFGCRKVLDELKEKEFFKEEFHG